MSGLKPGPTARTGFLATCEAVPFQSVSTPTGKMLQIGNCCPRVPFHCAPREGNLLQFADGFLLAGTTGGPDSDGGVRAIAPLAKCAKDGAPRPRWPKGKRLPSTSSCHFALSGGNLLQSADGIMLAGGVRRIPDSDGGARKCAPSSLLAE